MSGHPAWATGHAHLDTDGSRYRSDEEVLMSKFDATQQLLEKLWPDSLLMSGYM